MVGMALHHHVARQLGQEPAVLFDRVADRLPEGPVPDLLRKFGARKEITLRAFGWQQIDTADGPDFIPAPSASPVSNDRGA